MSNPDVSFGSGRKMSVGYGDYGKDNNQIHDTIGAKSMASSTNVEWSGHRGSDARNDSGLEDEDVGLNVSDDRKKRCSCWIFAIQTSPSCLKN